MNTDLQQHLYSLPQNKLIELKQNINTAGLIHSNGNTTKKYFRGLASESSGRLKKIYIALSKGNSNDLSNAFDLFVE